MSPYLRFRQKSTVEIQLSNHKQAIIKSWLLQTENENESLFDIKFMWSAHRKETFQM